MYTQRKKNTSYGNFMQDGGMMQEAPVADPQAEAQAFLEAFQQISPEAQQLVIQALTQQG